jgi:hypothetical protein
MVVGLFFLVEPDVLKKNHFAVLHCIHGGFHCGAYHIIKLFDGLAKKLRKAIRHGVHSVLIVEGALGPAKVGDQDNLCALIKKVLYCGECGLYPAVIRDVSVLILRDVKIYANKNALALDIYILNSLFVHLLPPDTK